MPNAAALPWPRRLAAEAGLWACVGVVMAVLGPFGSSERTLVERLAYWLICMLGGGVIGTAFDELVRRVTHQFWVRLLAVSVLMTPLVVVLVAFTNHWLGGMRLTWVNLWTPWFEVFVVCFAAMLFRQLVWSRAPLEAALAQAGLEAVPDPVAAFRRRLSAKRREATLIAVEAEDHYLRVHTDAGEELITARFRDALAELAAAKGFQTHRSWWVAADAIDAVRWSRGRGEARLKCGLTVPISRSQAAPLKAAGWF